MNVDDMPELQRLSVEKLRFRARQYMSAEAADGMTVEITADYIAESFVANMCGFVWQNQIHKQTDTMNVHVTWWDHFKDTFFPEWLKRRIRVRYNVIPINTQFIHTCPHLPIESRDDLRMHMTWMMAPQSQQGVWG